MDNSIKGAAEIAAALNWLKVETGSLACLGCEHESGCSIHGCAILRDAADALNELQRAAAPGWIGVNERLPERFVAVIVCREDGKVEAGQRDVKDWWKVYGTRTKRVIAWMPLPAPPRKDGGANDR